MDTNKELIPKIAELYERYTNSHLTDAVKKLREHTINFGSLDIVYDIFNKYVSYATCQHSRQQFGLCGSDFQLFGKLVKKHNGFEHCYKLFQNPNHGRRSYTTTYQRDKSSHDRNFKAQNPNP